MSRDPNYSPFGPMPGERLSRPGELLFEFHVEQTHTFYRVELRDHGEYGVEAMFLNPIDLVISRTFHQRLDPTRTPREMAIAWAEEERKAIEEGGA